MMENLLLQEGDVVALRSATLPKGTFVKLQPHSTDFLDITNPRAVLETTLRNFSCLTGGWVGGAGGGWARGWVGGRVGSEGQAGAGERQCQGREQRQGPGAAVGEGEGVASPAI